MSEEDSGGDGGGDLTCHWGECTLSFGNNQLLDGHVESVHIKLRLLLWLMFQCCCLTLKQG
jgi:hypothetical protein